MLEGAHDRVHVHAPDGRDLGPGHGLLVGDDGQRLQRGRRQPDGLAFQHEALHVGVEVGVALEAPTPGDAHHDEAAVLGLVGRAHLRAHGLHPLLGQLQHLGQQVGLDGLLRHHEDGLDRPALLLGHQPWYSSIVSVSTSSPSQRTRSSPKFSPWSRSTRPSL